MEHTSREPLAFQRHSEGANSCVPHAPAWPSASCALSTTVIRSGPTTVGIEVRRVTRLN